MEALRQRRPKICVSERSSGHSASRGGRNRQFQRQEKFRILAAESDSQSSSTTDEDLIMFDLGQRYSTRAVATAATPIKKLLAREMLRENEYKKQSPSLIARLMGLEGFPLQQSTNKLSKRYTDVHQPRRKGEKAERGSTCSSRRSSRKSSKEEQEFKDVFEVSEMSALQSSGYLPQGTANSNMTEPEMEFIRQKFLDAKRLSTDDKLHCSKEFDDALEVLESNKDLLFKFLQQPDPLFTKHLHDLQGPLFQSHFGQVPSAKSSDAFDYEAKSVDSKSSRGNGGHSQIHHSNFSNNPLNSTAHNSVKSSKLEGKVVSDILPTRIVVLKPNLGKTRGGTKHTMLPNSQSLFSDSGNRNQLRSFRNKNKELSGKRSHRARVDYKESLDIAGESTRRMQNYDSGSAFMVPLTSRGYAGDESSSTMSLSDSAYDSDATALTYTKSVDCKSRCRHASSTESSVSREATKRLSERWKMTHKSQEIGETSRGSTLAEMLAIPAGSIRSADPGQKVARETFHDEFADGDASASCVEPLGISSRDGWKDVCMNKLSRSRSLPSSSTVFASPRVRTHSQGPFDFRLPMAREIVRLDKNKIVKENFDVRDIFVSRKVKYRHIERHPFHLTSGESSDASSDYHSIQHMRRSRLKGIDQPEQSVVSEALSGTALCNIACMEPEMVTSFSENSNVDYSSNKVNSDVMYPVDVEPQEPSRESPDSLGHSVPEPESSVSPKEADQPSPVSILEAPFSDDLSSGSECFESLNADLQGLRMQLRLLKLESQSYAEGHLLISSDEDVGEGPTRFHEDRGLYGTQDSWEASYIADILVGSGYNDSDPEMFIAKWHSPECPVNPLVFEELEKKYFNQNSLRSERKLLFDRVNMGMVETHQEVMNLHPWLYLEAASLDRKRNKQSLQDSLVSFLVSQDKKGGNGVLDKLLTSESQWLNLKDDIEAIGREVERLMIDDLLDEVVPCLDSLEYELFSA